MPVVLHRHIENHLKGQLAGHGPGKHQLVVVLVHSKTLAQDWMHRLAATGSSAVLFRPSVAADVRQLLLPGNSQCTSVDCVIAGKTVVANSQMT